MMAQNSRYSIEDALKGLHPEVKLLKDPYPGSFANGLTMCESESARLFKLTEQNDGVDVYEDGRGHKILIRKERIDTPFGTAYKVSTEFINQDENPCTLEMLASFAVSGVRASRLHRLMSFWSAEGRLKTETLAELHLEPSWNRWAPRVESFGNLGSMPVRRYFPFLAAEDDSGSVFGVQLYAPSSWQLQAICRQPNTLLIAGGLPDRDFGQWTKTLAPGESFVTPSALISVQDSLLKLSSVLTAAQRPDVSSVDSDMGIAFNEYCTTWGNPSFERVKQIADSLEGRGIKYLVIDAGWFGKDNWWDSTGDWEVNEKRFPGGMKPIADYIRSKGMIPGIWFELESVSVRSKHFNSAEHLVKRDGLPLTVGSRRFWDMEDPWVKDYLRERVIGLLKSCGFGYIKIDYNDTMGAGCDGPDGIGENLRRKVEATKDFFRELKRELPELVIESCSSGGHRLEPSILELCSQASFSDAHEPSCIPIIAANLHRVVRPSQSQIWAVLRKGDSDKRIAYSLCAGLLGRLCLSGDIPELSLEQWSLVSEGLSFYRSAADIIKYGRTELIECSSESYDRPTGNQLLIRELNGTRLAVIHRFGESATPDYSFLEGKNIISRFSSADGDFTAEAVIYR